VHLFAGQWALDKYHGWISCCWCFGAFQEEILQEHLPAQLVFGAQALLSTTMRPPAVHWLALHMGTAIDVDIQTRIEVEVEIEVRIWNSAERSS